MTGVETTQDAAKLILQDKTVIVGLGKTGLSCVRFLMQQGVTPVIVDSREQPPQLSALREEFPDVQFLPGEFADDVFTGCEQLIISPGIALREPAIAAALASGVSVLGDIELFARYADAPVLAITGSNGKSTVTALLGEMAQAAGKDVRVGGNIGTPALDLLGNKKPDLYVLELSSFQLETTHSLNAAVAVILNLSPDHLDRYRNIEEYRRAKQHIYNGTGVVVVNNDDPALQTIVPEGRACVRFGLAKPSGDNFGLLEKNGSVWLAKDSQCLMPASELRIIGQHNVANALAALAMGDAIGLPQQAMLNALRSFKGLPHRMEWVAEHKGVNWYNDSKGTNVGAALAALRGLTRISHHPSTADADPSSLTGRSPSSRFDIESTMPSPSSSPSTPSERRHDALATKGGENYGLDGKLVWIGGGIAKGADFSPLSSVLADMARAVILIGQDAALIEAGIEAGLKGISPIIHADDMEVAVSQANRYAQPGDTVLLSPACASFDMYRDYQERGEDFMAAVRRMLS